MNGSDFTREYGREKHAALVERYERMIAYAADCSEALNARIENSQAYFKKVLTECDPDNSGSADAIRHCLPHLICLKDFVLEEIPAYPRARDLYVAVCAIICEAEIQSAFLRARAQP